MGSPIEVDPIFFPSPAAFRRWLKAEHEIAGELWVGYYKKATGRPTQTWSESVDQALCFGWVDGLRKSIDGERYKIRFTPRRPTSHWSAVNIRKMDGLTKAGLVHPAGERAFAALIPHNSELHAVDGKKFEFDAGQLETFRANRTAWEFFASQPTGYRNTATRWVNSAKREATRARRLATLISDSEVGLRIKQLRR